MTQAAPRVLIVEARFYPDIADELVKGAEAVLKKAGAEYDRIEVPGAFEIPGAIAMAAHSSMERYDGYLALGCVIRGETSHYDYVCGETARGLMDLAVQHQFSIGYGILTVETSDQAWARAKTEGKNKGGSAAQACLEMIRLKARFAGKA